MNNQRSTPGYPSQFAILLALFGVFMVVGSLLVALLGMALMDVSLLKVPDAMNKLQFANMSRFLNTLAAFIAFLLPAVIFARIIGRRPFKYLGFNVNVTGKQALLVLFITVASMMLSGALGELNEHIPLSDSLIKKARALEETYKQAMMAMAHMKTPVDFILSLLALALAPAIFEEVLFRGAFQQVFIGWTQSAWIGIVITSIIFSAIHFSYFGFLPRLALGLILGFIFYYSKNIWLNILLHFLNNAFVVIQLYILGLQGKPIDRAMDDSMPVWWGIVGVLVLVVLFRFFRKESIRINTERNIINSEITKI